MARLFVNISSFGWVSFSSFFLWFILAFTGKKKILKKKWFYLLLLGIPLVLIYKQWTNFIFVDYIKEYYGWRGLYGTSIWPYLFFSYYLSFMGISFYIIVNFIKNTRDLILKKQAKIIFVTMVISLVLGSITDVLSTLLDIHVIPNIADACVLIWAFGVVYAIVKYKFLTITPATAADNILSTMHDSLILLDLEGNIVTVNKAALDLLEYRQPELKGAPLSTLLTREQVTAGLAEEIIGAGNFKDKELIFKTSKAKEIPVLLSGSVLLDNVGAARGMVYVAKDISQRKKMEEEMLRTKKLESIGILAGGIAHDFNNLLYAILGNVELALEEIIPGERGYENLKKLKTTTLKAAQLARKFVTFSQGGWLKREKISLISIINRVMQSEPDLKNKNIIYDTALPQDLAPIDGDEFQVHQLMQNLFRNAAEAIPPGERGRILLGAENITVEEANEVENENKLFLKSGQYVKIFIEDNGMGIPPDNIEKVFDPYFSTKERSTQKGMGLGLTLCYSIVKKHGGHIRLESEPGKGTIVTLYLPAYIG